MPIPHLLLTNLMLGALCAWSGRAEVRLASRSAIANQHFAGMLIGQGLLMLPLGIYLYLFYPDWSWLYLVRAADVPSAVIVVLLLGYPMAAVVGYLAAVTGCRANRDRFVMGLLGTGTGVLFMGILLSWNRVSVVGTYEQFQRHFGLLLLQKSGLGAFLVAAALGVGGGWVITLVRLRRNGGERR